MWSDAFSSMPFWLVFLLLQASSVQLKTCPILPTSDALQFSRLKFDYLIVGGGTAGLTLASKLSENNSIVVGVLEAGLFHQNDPLVDVPINRGHAVGNASYDWNFATTPEPALGGRSIATPRGKMLGGSSGLNLLAWTRASKEELDIFESFAPNSGWNWQGLLPYFKQTENVLSNQTNPFPGLSQEGTSSGESFEGHNGPVQASLNVIYPDIVPQYVESYNTLGIRTNVSPDNGSSKGISNGLLTIDRYSGTRSYAATAYFCPSSSRTNLHVLVDAQATKVTFQDRTPDSPLLTADGIEFSVGSNNFTAKALKEVILSAGTVQTPQLLELSGIGNTKVLKKAGITTLLNSPGVGENLQVALSPACTNAIVFPYISAPGTCFHTCAVSSPKRAPYLWKVTRHPHSTITDVRFDNTDELRNNATFAAEQAAQYNASHTGLLAASDSTLAFIPLIDFVESTRFQSILAAFDNAASQPGLSPMQIKQYKIQRNWLTQNTVPEVETIMLASGLIAPVFNESYITVLGGLLHPLSRGSIHINSSNPFSPPTITGNYLSNSFDANAVLETVKFIGSLLNVSSTASIVQNMTNPASVDNDANTIGYIRATLSTADHIAGTAAMAPYDLGGVVNGELRVYNTTNLRVVDASVIPLLPGTHIQSLAYVIGAKAASIILGQ